MHYFTKYGFGEVYFSDMDAMDENDEKPASEDEISPRATPTSSPVTARKVVPNQLGTERERDFINIC